MDGTAVTIALAGAAVFGTGSAGFALVLLADTIPAFDTWAAVLRTGLAILALPLLAPAIAAIIGRILAQAIAATNLPVGALAATAAAAIGATLFVGALGHANALALVIAD